MAFKDIRGYMKMLQEQGELLEIEGADTDLEIGCIAEMMCERRGPALLFDKIRGYQPGYRVASNFFQSKEGVGAPAYGLPSNLKGLSLLKAWREKIKNFRPIAPREVGDGAVMENVMKGDAIDITKFPTPKWNEFDGGRYIGTGCVEILQDPDTGYINTGCYRVQIHDKNKVGLYISPGAHGRIILEKNMKKGKPTPIAVSFGGELSTFIATTFPAKWGISEYGLAGYLRGEPVDVIRGPITGLPIPANEEIVIEGEILPNDEMLEGPFGEWCGYYAHGALPEPVIRIKAIYHRDNPIIHGYPVRKPPVGMAISTITRSAAIWDELEGAGLTGIKGVWQMKSGGPHFCTIVAINQQYGGHAKQVALAAAGVQSASYAQRLVIVVDDDIDITDTGEVMWAVCSRCDPKEDMHTISNTWSTYLDPRIEPERKEAHDVTTSKALIVACKPYKWKERFPKTMRFTDDYREKVLQKWSSIFDGKVSGN